MTRVYLNEGYIKRCHQRISHIKRQSTQSNTNTSLCACLYENLDLENTFHLLVQLTSKTRIQWNRIKVDHNWVFTWLLYWFMSHFISLGHTVELELFHCPSNCYCRSWKKQFAFLCPYKKMFVCCIYSIFVVSHLIDRYGYSSLEWKYFTATVKIVTIHNFNCEH